MLKWMNMTGHEEWIAKGILAAGSNRPFMKARSSMLAGAGSFCALLNAQPTINWGDAPSIGDQIFWSHVDCDPVINSGASQTWVIQGPAYPIPTQGGAFIAPSSAPGAANFPDATVAVVDMVGSSSIFLKVDATGLYITGFYNDANGDLSDYVDLWRFMAYPCTFGTSWTDNWSSAPVAGGVPTYVSDPMTYVADGYGTLVGNTGSMPNVLKVRSEEIVDSVIDGIQIHDTHVLDRFWTVGYPWWVAEVESWSHSENGELQFSDSFVTMIDELAIGIAEENVQQIGISLMPNPAGNEVRLSYGGAGDATIAVLDALGREVLAMRKQAQAPVIHQELLDVASLPPGAFLVRVITGDGQVGSRKLVIDR